MNAKPLIKKCRFYLCWNHHDLFSLDRVNLFLTHKKLSRNANNGNLKHISIKSLFRNLDYSDSVGHIQSIVILCQFDVAFLQTSRSDESVYFLAFDFVKFLDGRLDLTFVGFNINNENQCVAVFDQLHRGFCCQRVLDNTELVVGALLWDAGSGVLGLSGVLKSFGFVEVNFVVNAGSLLGNSLVQRL